MNGNALSKIEMNENVTIIELEFSKNNEIEIIIKKSNSENS
jgi:hypothetical protein